MRKNIKAKLYYFLSAAITLLLLLPVACRDSEEEVSRRENWITDLQWLADTLPGLHFNLFMYVPADSFYSKLDRLEENLDSLTGWEVVMELSRTLASMRCSHTSIGFWEYDAFSTYPLSLWWLDDGLYVTAITAEHCNMLGSRLLMYGGRPAVEAASAMSEMFPARNSVVTRTWATNFMMMAEPMQALGFGDADSAVPFTFLTVQGDTLTIRMEATSKECMEMVTFTETQSPELPLWLQSDDFYWFRYLPDHKLLYCAYNTCAPIAEYPMSAFIEDMNRARDSLEVEGIVVDLRRNTGGNSLVAEPLITWLQEISEEGRTEIFPVIGRWTYSSGILNAIQIKEVTGAMMFGERTSGAPNHLGEVRRTCLPWSGLSVSYPTKYFRTVEGEGATLVPDVVIPLTSEALFTGRDPVLQAIVELMDRSEI